MGTESVFYGDRAQTVDENGYILGVLKGVWEYIKEFRFLHPEICDFVGHFKEKRAIKAHNVFLKNVKDFRQMIRRLRHIFGVEKKIVVPESVSFARISY